MMHSKTLFISSSPGEDRILGITASKAKEFASKRFDMGPLVNEIYLGQIQQWSPAMNGFFMTLGKYGNAFMPLGKKNQSAFKPGDLIPVTITRSSIDEKTARVSSDIVLPGPRLLFIPSKPGVHLSHRARFKSGQNGQLIIHHLKSNQLDHILIRETAIGANFDALHHEASFLEQMWRALKEEIRITKQPGKLRYGTEYFDWLISSYLPKGEIYVGNEQLFNNYRMHWQRIAPDLKDNIKLIDSNRVDAIIQENLELILSKKVTFGRTGSLIIEETEALTSIDVNVFAGHQKTNNRQQLNVNLSAIPEIVRQIRLRNLAGIIIIDFINMQDEAMNKAVEAEMIKQCADDPAEIDILPISKLGIMQLSREKTGPSINRLYYDHQADPILSFKTIVLNLFRALNSAFLMHPNKKITIHAQREFLEKLRAGNHIVDLLPEDLLNNLIWLPDDKIDFHSPYYQIDKVGDPVFV